MFIKYALRRVIASIPVLFGVTILAYLLIWITAGDIVPGLELNPAIKHEDVVRIRHNLGLDQPVQVQYLNWLGVGYALKQVNAWPGDPPKGLLEGDFGTSIIDGTPVIGHILDRLPNTLELALMAIIIGILIAIPLGVTGALRRGSRLDHFLTTLSVAGVSIPAFWLGLLMILLFSVSFKEWGLPWLPSGGAQSSYNGGDFMDRLVHLLLPATVLSFGYLAIWSRYTRSSMLEVLSQDFVRTARAKGMPERVVVVRHALRNSLVPIATIVALDFGAVLGGAIITEQIFAFSGMGQLFQTGLNDVDVNPVMGYFVVISIMTLVFNFIADLTYSALDPRVRTR